ncbi:hybrid sensor histidine kinase/response regulator [Roseisolibacter agri]|uniref:histidine kinase n=1 Tax=Roseisolibacter agri TaxID=2014610 RepID=A0AA37VEA6_9BACT|nr:hybrid sensor histidine kinase/response regulator [Roseisolibacter agri]GLC24854.1 hypothetical protein rosag_13670 [Roseisolibacter agri]
MDTTDCTILLVDDEVANLDLLEVVLRPKGYRRLVRVSDARRAMDAFDAARPDLVLLDLHMPHRDGFAVLADIAARVSADAFVPVLVLTADVTAAARERALAGGAHDLVLKPFDRVEVLLRVRNLLRTRLLHESQRRARAAAELLADAGRVLVASLDGATAPAQLAALLADRVADACAVELVVDGACVRVAEAGIGAADASWEVRVPLHAADAAPIGWLSLARGATRAPFDDDDRALAAEVARRAGLALERARLLQATQAAVTTRDHVLAVVAHDLRGPLAAVRFDVEMLRAAETLAEPDARTLARVERAAARMDGLIEDLLDVARLDRDALALERQPQDVHALLEEAATTLRPLVASYGLRFEVSFDLPGDAALPAMDVDARRLLQAVSNLVGNAAKFAAHDGCVALTWTVTDGELRIAVRDDGPGIPADQVQHIFGAFWQARHADRRGLGLGLAIARAVVEAHGGRLWVESVVGEGSTFVIALPIARSEGQGLRELHLQG